MYISIYTVQTIEFFTRRFTFYLSTYMLDIFHSTHTHIHTLVQCTLHVHTYDYVHCYAIVVMIQDFLVYMIY